MIDPGPAACQDLSPEMRRALREAAPRRPAGREAGPEIGREIGKLSIVEIAREARHRPKLFEARRRPEAFEDDAQRRVGRIGVKRGVQRQRRLHAEHRRALSGLVADRAGAGINSGAGQMRRIGGAPLRRLFQPGLLCRLRCRRRRRKRGQVMRHGPYVLVRRAAKLRDDGRHGAASRAVLGRVAGPQIVEIGLLRPGDGRGRNAVQRGRVPALDLAAREMAGAVEFRAERVARRMTGGAVPEPLDEIGAQFHKALRPGVGTKG